MLISKLILSVVFLLTLFSFNHVAAEDLPQACQQDCEVEYGIVLGNSKTGVEAYSNCSSNCVNPAPYFVDGTYTGIKWQCVEYVRRWLLINKGVVYGDVDVAADIWQLETVHSADKKVTKSLKSILNGDKRQSLQRGDLLIYSRAFLDTGHVAVVFKIDEKNQRVYVGEQNFDNQPWQGDAAREIPYVIYDGGIWLLDPYLIGWKRVID